MAKSIQNSSYLMSAKNPQPGEFWVRMVDTNIVRQPYHEPQFDKVVVKSIIHGNTLIGPPDWEFRTVAVTFLGIDSSLGHLSTYTFIRNWIISK